MALALGVDRPIGPKDRVLYRAAGISPAQMHAKEIEQQERADDGAWKIAVRKAEQEAEIVEERARRKGVCPTCRQRRALSGACWC